MSASKVSPFFRYNYIVFPLLFQEDSRLPRGNHMCFPYRSPCTISRSSEARRVSSVARTSGRELLVPPRSSARMRLKEALPESRCFHGAIATGNRFIGFAAETSSLGVAAVFLGLDLSAGNGHRNARGAQLLNGGSGALSGQLYKKFTKESAGGAAGFLRKHFLHVTMRYPAFGCEPRKSIPKRRKPA